MPVMVAPSLKVTDEQRKQLEAMSRSSSIPHRKVVQATGLLLAADGVANEEIARRCHTTPDTVRRLLARCLDRDVKSRLQAIGEARVTLEEATAPARGRDATERPAATRSTSTARGKVRCDIERVLRA